MFWDRLFGERRTPSPSDAGRALAALAARKREADAVPVAVSVIRPRDEVVAETRARLARQKEQRA